MPKAKLKITDFSGGLSTKKHSTDLEDNESSVLIGFSPSISGKLKSVGSDSLASDIISDSLNSFEGYLNIGYGLSSFSADYSIEDNKSKRSKYLVIPDLGNINILEKGFGVLHDKEIVLSDSNDAYDRIGMQHCYYNVSTNNTGGLRISDGNFDNAIHYSKVYQYMKKTWFYGMPILQNNNKNILILYLKQAQIYIY